MIGALLCRTGWHDADPDGRWNGGYCFTRCRRCGRDMVRSAFGEWHVPKGYRVVWGPPGSVADLDRMLAEERRPPEPAVTVAVSPATADVPTPRPRRIGPSTTERSPFDFGDFDQTEERAGGGDPFAAPPEMRRRAPPA